MAMEPIADKGGSLGVFYVEHNDDGRWLDALYGGPASFWGAGNRWVFARRN